MNVIDWLLESDPAIRWQTMRDLTDAPADDIAAERARVATEGWGARLLKLRHPGHQWSDGSSTSYIQTPDGSSVFTLTIMREMGIDPANDAVREVISNIRDTVTHYEGNPPFFEGETEACINGRVLAAGAYFGEPNEALLERLLREQQDDGGWNCEYPKSKRSSFHSTICVLEGLLEWEHCQGTESRITEARSRGEEYLLQRHLFRKLSTGEVIDPNWTNFSFPTGYHYDVLRGLDYLRQSRCKPDERITEAIDLVQKNRADDGRWPLQTHRPGQIRFDIDEPEGQPSRWNTLRGLRVLHWAEHSD